MFAIPLKQSTAVTVRIGPFRDRTDGVTEETGLSLAATDVQVSKAWAAFANKNSATAPTHDSDGWYTCALDTTDTGTLGPLVIKVQDPDTFLPVRAEFIVLPANVYDSLISGSDNLQVDTTQIEGSDATDQINAACDTALTDYDALVPADLPANFADLAITASTGRVTAGTVVDKTGYSISGTKTTLDALNDIAATDIVSGGAITTSGGAVSNVTLVATTTTNTDMRGTDNAILASSAPTNFSDLAITATTGRVTVGTNNDKTGYSISGTITTLDALDTAQDTQHSTTQSAISALNDFDPTTDTVARVTLVDTTTANTDMRGTDNALLASSAPTNFGDLAITVTTGQVTVGTNNDKSGYSITGTITTLDALDTAQDAQHSTTRSAITTLNDIDAAGVRTAIGLSSANLDTQLSTIDTVVDGVKAKTDSLTFTTAGQVDANVQYVNDVAVGGTGASGDEWGPA